MNVKGRLNFVQDAATAFKPVILNSNPPTSGFMPWANVTITAFYYYDLGVLGVHSLQQASTATDAAGDFSFPPPPAWNERIGRLDSVSLQVNPGVVVYRTNLVSAREMGQPFDIWVYVDRLRETEGITASTISQEVQSAGLPGNTTITAGSPNGLNFAGSRSEAKINFNVLIGPDTSTNLDNLLDLSLNGYNIHVGWPDSWCKSAGDILKEIESGITSADSAANANILARITQELSTDDDIPLLLAQNFLDNQASITFMGVGAT
jgi:hypothetical protein